MGGMSLSDLVPVTIRVSIVLYVFALGLGASVRDVAYLARNPGLLVRSLVSMNIIMPLFATAVAVLFNLHPAIKIAIIALALSPVPPALPNMQTKAGGTASYAISMLTVLALFAVVIVPAGVDLAGKTFTQEIHMTAGAVMPIVLRTVLIPLVLGLMCRKVAPSSAERVARYVSAVATVLLIGGVVPLLFIEWPAMKSMIGSGAFWVLSLFTLVGLIVGHRLGGPVPENRTVLALATARRHPAVALAIANTDFPDEKAVLAVVCWHLIVGGILSIPYVIWRKRKASNR